MAKMHNKPQWNNSENGKYKNKNCFLLIKTIIYLSDTKIILHYYCFSLLNFYC